VQRSADGVAAPMAMLEVTIRKAEGTYGRSGSISLTGDYPGQQFRPSAILCGFWSFFTEGQTAEMTARFRNEMVLCLRHIGREVAWNQEK
jgi:hypothetical protein